MNRQIIRSYFFTDNEINNILYLKTKDIPAPEYVGNAGTTTWHKEKTGVRVEWTEKDDVEI